MAAKDDGGFNEDDDFDEYNPHPYGGGYDIALTYGNPLPHSSSICYRISSPGSGPPPPSPAPIAPTPPPPAPAPPKPTPAPAPAPAPAPVPEPVRYPPYDYGENGYQPEPYSPDYFRSWPFSGWDAYWRRGEVKEYDHWNQLMRGLDYLFGHAQGYGERRAGIDRYGIPIYANKKSSIEPVAVEIEPPRAQRLDFYYTRDGQVYPEEENYRCGEPFSDSISGYQERGRHNESFSHYDQREEESNFFGNPIYSYDRYSSEQPLHVQIQPAETAWAQKYDSYENYSSYEERGEEGHIFEMSNHAYEKHSIAQPEYVQLEPFKPSWSQNLGFYQAYDEGVSLEPNYRSNYYEDYVEPTSPRSNWQSSSFEEQGVVSSLFSTSDYAQENHYYEQPLGDQLEPFEPSWTSPSYYDIFKVDGSNYKTDNNFFG
ncbi:uncharacterized protein [Typha latifolia]|uniref:uncharacterized protein n=1 Tax=Typha latifolia TaxID=4733 RepID=UPI003C2E9684